MERQPMRLEAELMGVLQHVGGHRGLAAEFARQRPFRACAIGQDAAEDARTGGDAGNLLDLGLAIHGVEPDAEGMGARDVALLLDGVAIGDAVGGGAGGEHHLDLGDRGGIEAGAEPGQKRQHLRRRVCLHRVEHARVGQSLRKGRVIVPHHVEVDHEASLGVEPAFAAVAQELTDARGHGALPHTARGRRIAPEMRVFGLSAARGGCAPDGKGSRPAEAALAWIGRPRTARPAMKNKPLQFRGRLMEGRQRPRSPSVVALSRVPR